MPANPSRSVLVIDDDVEWQTTLAGGLRGRHCHVTTVGGFANAYTQVTCRPNAVIMESAIGGEPCLPLLRFIQSSQWYPHVTVLSGRAPRELVFQLREHGVSAFLEKPQHLETLLSSLMQHWKAAEACPPIVRAPVAAAGLRPLHSWVPERLLHQAKEVLELTPAELDIVRYAACGHRRDEIAQLRRTTENTVKSQIRTLLDKAQSRSLRDLLRRIVSGALATGRSDSTP